jgi:hypothetical protein
MGGGGLVITSTPVPDCSQNMNTVLQKKTWTSREIASKIKAQKF